MCRWEEKGPSKIVCPICTPLKKFHEACRVKLDCASNRVVSLVWTISSIARAAWWIAWWVHCNSYLNGSNCKYQNYPKGVYHWIRNQLMIRNGLFRGLYAPLFWNQHCFGESITYDLFCMTMHKIISSISPSNQPHLYYYVQIHNVTWLLLWN